MAVSLDTLNATVISKPIALGVAFDTKTSKIIWSESNRSIRRAYPNGTELEVLKTGTGKSQFFLYDHMTTILTNHEDLRHFSVNVFAVAMDALTGNVYFGEYDSYTDNITVCNNNVQNCVVLATSPDVDDPIGIAVHSQQRYFSVILYLSVCTKGSLNKPGFQFYFPLIVDTFTGQIVGLCKALPKLIWTGLTRPKLSWD